jgi:hypothetical protein
MVLLLEGRRALKSGEPGPIDVGATSIAVRTFTYTAGVHRVTQHELPLIIV